ncbi:MAG: hypothetical protein ACYCXZ_00545 [Coriobacteriia bacterium]
MQRAPSPAARRWLIVLTAAGAALVIAAAGSIVYGATAETGCASCHDGEPFVAGTAAAPHAGISCAACHMGSAPVDRLSFGFRRVFHMTIPLMSGEGRGWEEVPDARCSACHGQIAEAPSVSNGLSMAHATCTEGLACTDCHSTTGHGAAISMPRVYDMETCLACHVSMSSTDCGLCHEGQLPSDRITSGTFAITHGPQWRETHGMGDATTCQACHSAASCEKCHGAGLPHGAGFVQDHAGYAASENAQCGTCHEQRFCSDCHGLEMPHPREFTRKHSAEAEANESLCVRCHAAPDCTQCHETHVHPGGAIDAGARGDG